MTYLVISDNLYTSLNNCINDLSNVSEIYKTFYNKPEFMFLMNSAKTVLAEEKYVVLKNTPFCTAEHLEALISFFGNFYGRIEHTGIKVDCNYTGCASSKLTLHNDDAIDLISQPTLGFIQVIKEDPLLKVTNGIVVVRELIRKLKFEDPTLLELLLNNTVPMFSLGVNYESEDKSYIDVKSPILYKEDGQYKVRFDYDRIMFYYQYHNIKQSHEEGQMIYKFLQYCESIKSQVLLNKGDILIHQNKLTLHDRTPCSIGIDVNQQLFSREIFVSFAL